LLQLKLDGLLFPPHTRDDLQRDRWHQQHLSSSKTRMDTGQTTEPACPAWIGEQQIWLGPMLAGRNRHDLGR